MKNFFILLISTIILFSCKKEFSGNFVVNDKLDSLISIANNSDNEKVKIKLADKILIAINENYNDTINRKRYFELIKIYYSLNNIKYVNICKSLLSNQPKNVNLYESTFCNYLLGNFYYNSADFEESFYYLNQSEIGFLKLENFEYAGLTIISKANILTFKKDFTEAEKLSIKALKIAKRENYSLLKYNSYITLGNSLTGLNNFEKAIDYYQKAIDAAENLKLDPSYLSYKLQPLNYISTVYQKQKNHIKALQSSTTALKLIKDKNKEILLYSYLTNNLAYSKFKLGDKSSLNQFQETLKIGDSIKSIPIVITSKTYLGEYYLKEKDTVKANFYLQDAQLQAHKNNILEDELKILQLLAQSNHKKEGFYTNRYITLNDSLQNVERATRDKFARIEFETDEITQENKIIFKKNTELYNSLWFIIGISILSIMLFYLLYKNNIQKAKNREMLLIQQQQEAEIRELNLLQEQKNAEEEIFQLMLTQQNKYEEGKNSEKQRMSLELHDDITGSLSSVRLLLFGELKKINLINTEPFRELLDKIKQIELDTTKIARDLNTNIFSNNANFVEVVNQLFNNSTKYSSVQFELNIDPNVNFNTINNDIKINLYRIIQEALHNIEKYAQASKVSIAISQVEKTLTIKIIDNGKGYDKDVVKEGIGIINMKTRMKAIHGSLDIISDINIGTKIYLSVSI